MADRADHLGVQRAVLALLLAAGAVLGLASSASAATAPATVVVQPGQSIADALRRVGSGGTVVLAAGTHRPATIGPKAWAATVTLRPAAGATVELGELHLRGVENLRITGVRTRGVVTIDGGRNVDVVDSRPAGVLVKNGASAVDVLDNTIVGGWNGVAVHGYLGAPRPHHVRIAGNHISGQTNDNIQIGIADDVTVEDNVLLDPVENHHHNDGVQFMGGKRLVVRHNWLQGQDQAILLKGEAKLGADHAVVDALLEDNIVYRTRHLGIVLVDTVRTTLRDNVVREIPTMGVVLVGTNVSYTAA